MAIVSLFYGYCDRRGVGGLPYRCLLKSRPVAMLEELVPALKRSGWVVDGTEFFCPYCRSLRPTTPAKKGG